MIDLSQQRLVLIVLSILSVAAAIYLVPFVISPLITIISTLWQYFIGVRQRNRFFVTSPRYESVGDSTPAHSKPATSDVIAEAFSHEEKHQTDRLAIITKRLEEIETKAKKAEEAYGIRTSRRMQSPVGKVYHVMVEKLSAETGKNVLLLVAIVGILIVDTLISQHIFSSLGLYSRESLKFYGQKIDYTTIYAFFITVAVASLLHIVWPRKKVKALIAEKKWIMLAGLVVLIVVAVIRIITVINADWALQLMEVVILIAWIIGVVSVYWLIGAIVGDEKPDGFKLVVAIGIPIVLALLVLGGSILILEIVCEWLVKFGCECWLGLRRARIAKQEMITQERLIKNKSGFYRGFNF